MTKVRKCIVFSGTPSKDEKKNFSDFAEFEKLVKEKLDVDILKSVTSKVSQVIFLPNEKKDMKIKKAQEMGIDVIPIDEFLDTHDLTYNPKTINSKNTIKKTKKSPSAKKNKEEFIQSSDSEEDNESKKVIEKKNLIELIKKTTDEINYHENIKVHLEQIILRSEKELLVQKDILNSLNNKMNNFSE